MESKQYRSLDDIFNDPDVIEILKPLEKKPKSKPVDPEIKKFQELVEWIKDNDREPQKTPDLSTERTMYSRLKGFRKRPEKFRKYDNLEILDKRDDLRTRILNEIENAKNSKPPASLNDILSRDSVLFDGLDKDSVGKDDIFNTSKVTKKQKVTPESVAKRKKVIDFGKYKHMFQKVQQELASGKRQLRTFKSGTILLDHFYVLGGQLIYIDSFGEEITRTDKNGLYTDYRIRVIYENGTESNLLRRSLLASLYSNNRGGKIVTELEVDFKLTSDDYQTGYIYVLKSLSEDPNIQKLKPLYKIGVTTRSIQKRIANAKNEVTYLYAPVEIVEQIHVINLNAFALEEAIHHALEKYRLEIEIKDKQTGMRAYPKEWFTVELSVVEATINQIVAKLQSEQ